MLIGLCSKTRMKTGNSEFRCAQRMKFIRNGGHPLTEANYTVLDVAERYDVHRDTAYKGIRSGDPMFPEARPTGYGRRPRLVISREAIEICDRNRLAFYRTTPSWHDNFVPGSPAAPPRRSARAVIAEIRQRSK